MSVEKLCVVWAFLAQMLDAFEDTKNQTIRFWIWRISCVRTGNCHLFWSFNNLKLHSVRMLFNILSSNKANGLHWLIPTPKYRVHSRVLLQIPRLSHKMKEQKIIFFFPGSTFKNLPFKVSWHRADRHRQAAQKIAHSHLKLLVIPPPLQLQTSMLPFPG